MDITHLNCLIDRAASETDYDIAIVLKYIKDQSEFDSSNLSKFISEVVSQHFSRRSAYWTQKEASEEFEHHRCNDKAKKLMTIAMK